MIIANPMYDVIFKYLLEDTDIARELLSTILSENIVSLALKPQETTTEMPVKNINILRFDFKAVIQTETGELKKVLIELQKAKQFSDTMRFRRYLGDNYRKEDEVIGEQNLPEKRPLPIIAIYFLGFTLQSIPRPVVKISREYVDVLTQEVLDVQEDFVALLTPDSYFIQIKLLAGRSRSKLEQVLQVFNPLYETADKHQLDFAGEMNNPLVKKILHRLNRAVASEELRNLMDVEDEIEQAFRKKDSLLAQKDEELKAERLKAATIVQALADEKQKAATIAQELADEKQKAAEERKQTSEILAALWKELEALKKQANK